MKLKKANLFEVSSFPTSCSLALSLPRTSWVCSGSFVSLFPKISWAHPCSYKPLSSTYVLPCSRVSSFHCYRKRVPPNRKQLQRSLHTVRRLWHGTEYHGVLCSDVYHTHSTERAHDWFDRSISIGGVTSTQSDRWQKFELIHELQEMLRSEA